jgi:hypothetical protein
VTGSAAGEAFRLGDWHRRRTLILGEVGAGKTRLTARVAAGLARAGLAREMAVLDFAPERSGAVGGRIALPDAPEILYLAASVVPPRLTGRTPEEVDALARANALAIEPLLERCLAAARAVLVVNDLTLYLQAGDPARVRALLDRSETAVVNAYRGSTLGDGPLSRRERRRTDALAPCFHRVIRLSPPGGRPPAPVL